jgi:FlaA1/EpsC-like NDP-sugar epimerase
LSPVPSEAPTAAATAPAAASLWRSLDRRLDALRRHRQPVLLTIDLVVVATCWQLTYLFRLGFDRWWSARPTYDHWILLGLMLVYAAAFVALRVPRGLWRFAGFAEVRALAVACAVAGLTIGGVVWLAGLSKVPRSVLALHPVVTLMGLCVARMAYRWVYEHARAQVSEGQGEVRQALVLGAGEAARRLLATIHQQGWSVVGLLDDDPAKRGAHVGRVPVIGTLDAVIEPKVLRGVTHLVVALPGATAPQRRRAIELAGRSGLPVLTVPSASELQAGDARVDRVRAIEPEDLLGREPVALDEAGIAAMVRGRTVLVTGAGGSIGSELSRQLAGLQPAHLVLFELSEFALYQIEQQISEAHPDLRVTCLVGDAKEPDHIGPACQRHQPALVFHAAAYKHVPMMESANAWAAVRNNTLGTVCAARAAMAAGAERFILISTDKAVNPTNVMGASKRAAEMALAGLALEQPSEPPARGVAHAPTRLAAVRFGNVLGSSGSVIPKFKEQIARGGPVTVTHPDITRYFMTIPEASRLVLQAAVLAGSGEVWVLDMGEAVRIVDLARELIRLSGHRDGEIPIAYSGLRPGEKLHEELLADSDTSLPSAHPRLRIAQLAGPPDTAWLADLVAWSSQLGPETPPDDCRAGLARRVPEYRPSLVGDADRAG